jgi:hypothetical protein
VSARRFLALLVRRLRAFLPYLYFLRVPILTAVGIFGFCASAFFTSARLLLGNVFDISSLRGIFYVSLTAFLSGSVVVATWRLVRFYGPTRFFGNASPSTSVTLGPRDLILYLYALSILLLALS